MFYSTTMMLYVLLVLLKLVSSAVIGSEVKDRLTITTKQAHSIEVIQDVTTEGLPLETDVVIDVDGEKVTMKWFIKEEEPQSDPKKETHETVHIVAVGNGDWDTLHGFKDSIEDYEDWYDWTQFLHLDE